MKFFFTETENEQLPAEGEAVTTATTTEPQDEVVTLPKSEYNKMNRKAFAYDAIKKDTPKPKETDPDLRSDVENLKQIEAKRQFGYENQLSPEETDFIFRTSQGKPTKESLNDPFVKAGLEGYRQTKRVSENTPSSTPKGFAVTGKTFAELTDQERKNAFENDPRRRK